jgi:hypothetical protein
MSLKPESWREVVAQEEQPQAYVSGAFVADEAGGVQPLTTSRGPDEVVDIAGACGRRAGRPEREDAQAGVLHVKVMLHVLVRNVEVSSQ